MHFLNSLLVVSLATLSVALPTPDVSALGPTLDVALLPRQAAGATCGTKKYTSSAITAAKNKGCSYYQAGTTVGSNSYPHRYNNYEGFDFSTAAPWYEFPILQSGAVYTGGSPGPDRVIFNGGSCALTAVLTHTGASGNNFLECKYA